MYGASEEKRPRMRGSMLALLLCCAAVAHGEELTRDTLLTRLRASSPVVRSAEADVAATRAELSAASRLISENPTLEILAGTRKTPAGETTRDHILTLEQPLTVAGRRSARIEAAHAALDIAIARRDVVVRDALAGAATAYVRAAAVTARIAVA